MAGAATRRLGARLSPRADGTPGRSSAGTLLARQGTVTAAAAGVVTVKAPEDDDGVSAGYVGAQPRVGDVVLFAYLNGSPWVLGVQTPASPAPLLGRSDGTTGTAPSTGTNVLTLSVTIPAGLPAGTAVKVEGDVFVSTAAGIGSSIAMTGCSGTAPYGNPATRSVNASASYDGHIVGYDLNPPAGTRVYTLTVACLTAGQTATWRAPALRAELQLQGRG